VGVDSVFIHGADCSPNRSNGKVGVGYDVEDLLTVIYDDEACMQDPTTRLIQRLCAAAIGVDDVRAASGTVRIGSSSSVDVCIFDLREISITIENN